MEVRPGYKQTEVGVIPEEWEVRPLLTSVRIANGQVSPTLEPFKSMVLVAPDHIESSTGRLLAKETAEEQQAISGKYLFESGDIVYSKIRPYLRKAILADFSGLCSADMYPLKPAPDVSSGFILASILGYRFSKYAESVSVRSGMPKINRAEMADYSLGLPPLPEQRAIAAALGDVDALLGGLDRLIVKKHDLKQAALQQLLTGQTRLPGFSGEWDRAQLGDVADVSKGRALSKSLLTASGAYQCILYGELFTTYGRVISEVVSRTNASDGNRSVSGDVLLPGSTTTTGADLATASALLVEGVALGGDIIIVRRKGQGYDPAFLANYLTHTKRHDIAELTQGITIHHLYGKDLKTLPVLLPTLAEQVAIAAVFADMDAELAALEARREKTRDIKQAMMQELLTGKTRLV